MISLNAMKTDDVLASGMGTADGTIFAVPQRTTHATVIGIVISFSADPGATVFFVEVSLDGETFFTLGSTITGTDETPLGRSIPDFPWKFIKVSRTSQANDVVDTVSLVAV